LNEVTAEHATRDQEYSDRIEQLAINNAELAKENAQYKLRLEALQKELEALRRPRTAELSQVASPAPSAGTPIDGPCGGDCSCVDVIDKVLCERQKPAITSTPIVPLVRGNKPDLECTNLGGCGAYLKGEECVCYGKTNIPSNFEPKRSISPHINPPKRCRTVDYLENLETDFTTAYMSRSAPSSRSTPSIIHVPDPCGFCSDGTPCVCAEMANAMDMEDSDTDEDHHNIRLAPILGSSLGFLSPPSSSAGDPVQVHDRNKLPPLHPPNGTKAASEVPPAVSNSSPSGSSDCKPGGCNQCKNDPMSTLFCQSVATRVFNLKLRSAASPGGCCSENSTSGGCCKDIIDIEGSAARTIHRGSAKIASIAVGKGNKRPSTTITTLETEPVDNSDRRTFIPCSAAYQTLSRHHAFDDAAADLGVLVRPLVVKGTNGSCPQVEVSSVRDVLKMLDLRFARD
jgi:hypothetical protein